MKISLRTRPFLTEHDDNFNQENWDEKGILGKDDSLQIIKEFKWDEEVNRLQNSLEENKHLTIDQITEPGFNLYNQEDGTEAYIGTFGKDNFDLSLMSVEEENNIDIPGLSFHQIIAIIELFYQQKYDEIKMYSRRNQQNGSKLKMLLEERNTKQTAKKWRALVIRWILRVGIAVILYVILRLV
ncbi:MAG: hypothetical protein ACFB15_08115 [Cyclobacteriaceae bacterium]